MPTGRKTQQIGRSGECYVAAELNRRGYDATTFTGNLPHVDILAVTPRWKALYIQVKAQTGRGWAINVNERSRRPVRNMFWVLVLLRKGEEPPRYWVIPDAEMRAIIQGQYDAKPETFTGGAGNLLQLSEKVVAEWEGRWDRLR